MLRTHLGRLMWAVLLASGPSRATEAEDCNGNGIEDTLEVMDRWAGWNGTGTRGGGSVWTPHKSTRRIVDHLVDHIAQIECRIAGVAPVADTWRGRRMTVDADWARYTELDFEEARARIRRLAQVLSLRIAAHPELWDEGGEWSLRGIVDHLIQAMESYRAKPLATAEV